MANKTLSSFDPFATHPFTNNNALSSSPSPAKSSKQQFSIPSSSMTVPPSFQSGRSDTTPATPKSASQAPPKNIYAPQPTRPHAHPFNATPASRRTPQGQRKPIFVPFQQDRLSPELEEILLRKKLTQALGHVAMGLESKRYQDSSSSTSSESS